MDTTNLRAALAEYLIWLANEKQTPAEPIKLADHLGTDIAFAIQEVIGMMQMECEQTLKGSGECPECGSHKFELTKHRTFTDSPPEYEYFCHACNQSFDY